LEGAIGTLCLSICDCSKWIDEQKHGKFCYLFAYSYAKIMIEGMNSKQPFLAIMLFVCLMKKSQCNKQQKVCKNADLNFCN
jgi:hypothetical protein